MRFDKMYNNNQSLSNDIDYDWLLDNMTWGNRNESTLWIYIA
jgi:hypothetical protein